MNDYIFLMHNDMPEESDDNDWASYLGNLRASGHFNGGSAIGDGECCRRSGASAQITAHLAGYILVKARNLDEAKTFLPGNPVFEKGGTVEIRELPRTS